MEFPIRREQLQMYAYEYYPKGQRKKCIDNILSDISKKLEAHLLTSRERRFRYNVGSVYYNVGNGKIEQLTINELMDILKDKFIDCAIISDPLKTYILIDWS
jgi:hypothetical protein